MGPKSNNNRFSEYRFSLIEGLLLAVLLHLAVGLLYLYREGHIENFINRHRIPKSATQSHHPAPSPHRAMVREKRIRRLISDDPQKSTADTTAYEISISAFQKEDILFVKGWVSNGPPCDMLEIGMDIVCETGKNVFLRAALEKVDSSGSHLISMRRWVGRVQGKSFPQWSASVSYVNCLAK